LALSLSLQMQFLGLISNGHSLVQSVLCDFM
jgi:hypothetical protein